MKGLMEDMAIVVLTSIEWMCPTLRDEKIRSFLEGKQASLEMSEKYAVVEIIGERSNGQTCKSRLSE